MHNNMVTKIRKDLVTLHIHKTTNNTIGMMGKIKINLPTPTQFYGRSPQSNEWAGEVKVDLRIHNVHIEDYMDESSRLDETINIANIQSKYTTEDVNRLRQRFPTIPAEDEVDYDEYNKITLNIKIKIFKRDDITSFSQTLNYRLVHSTKPGSEAPSMARRIMKQSNGFLYFAQLCNQTGTQQQNKSHDNTTSGWKTLTDTNQKLDKEPSDITDHVKIATIINHLKRPLGQHLLLRVNTTTFGEVHQWTSNDFNRTYRGSEDEQGTIIAIGRVNNEDEQYMIAFTKWKKAKDNDTRERTKARTKQERKETTATTTIPKKLERTKESYTYGKTGHYSSKCYQNPKGEGNFLQRLGATTTQLPTTTLQRWERQRSWKTLEQHLRLQLQLQQQRSWKEGRETTTSL
eukprot:4792126-Amphidinium_carterae.2